MNQIKINPEELKKVKNYELDILKEVDKICAKNKINYWVDFGTLIGTIRHQGFIPWDDDIDICILRKDFERFRESCAKELDKKFFYQSHETEKEYYLWFDKIRYNNTIFKEVFLAKHNIHHGVYIDIFPMDNVPDDDYLRKKQRKKYQFYRKIVQAKYGGLRFRQGKKKVGAILIRVLTFFVPLEYAYRKGTSALVKYKDAETADVQMMVDSERVDTILPKKYYIKTQRKKFEDISVPVPIEYDKVLSAWYGDYMKLPAEKDRKSQHKLSELKL